MANPGDGQQASSAAPADEVMPPVVLFDFDGVLIHGDAFSLFVRQRYADSLLHKLLALLCTPLWLLIWPFAWRRAVRLLVRIAFVGVGAPRYAQLARAQAASLVRRPGLFCRDGLQAFRRHLALGERVIVVTGCEEQLVRGILDELGLQGFEVVASRFKPGWLGMKVAVHNIGATKPAQLRQLGLSEWAVAYGDSLHDVAMLRRAARPVLVNGTPRLCKKVERLLGRPTERVAWY
jgi:phosphatidylglycerophosphatase C